VVTMTSSISSEDYERLALEMLAVEAGDFADVKDAMRKIIASAPDGADVAFLLSRALAHAGDRASKGERSMSPNDQGTPSRWWVTAAVPFLGAAALFWCLGDLALKTPDDASDAAGLAAVSMFVISVGFLGTALIGVEAMFLQRRRVDSALALSGSLVFPPGWYVDPWGQGTSRWWNGSHWTGGLRG